MNRLTDEEQQEDLVYHRSDADLTDWGEPRDNGSVSVGASIVIAWIVVFLALVGLIELIKAILHVVGF